MRAALPDATIRVDTRGGRLALMHQGWISLHSRRDVAHGEGRIAKEVARPTSPPREWGACGRGRERIDGQPRRRRGWRWLRLRWGRKRAQGISSLPLPAVASRRRRRGASGCQAQSWSVRRPADSKHQSSGFRARYRPINTHAYTYALTHILCTYHIRARARIRHQPSRSPHTCIPRIRRTVV